jgi:hypothetical protein
MESAVTQTASRKPRRKAEPRTFEPLEKVTRPNVVTAEMAHYFNIAEQTARFWASKESGPIRPVRIHGVNALQWPVAEIRRVLGVQS